MKKHYKIILGIATLLYLLTIILYLVSLKYPDVTGYIATHVPSQLNPIVGIFLILFNMALLPLLSIILLIVYITDISKNKALSKFKQLIWVALIASVNPITMPIYWYLYIWKEPKQETGDVA